MSDIGEAIGTAAEGGLLARVLGRKQGKADAPAQRNEDDGTCLNCGAELTGAFCQSCGQKAHIHRTISAILHDLVHGVLHLDGKLWRTLPLLAFRPGKLTRLYIDGKRADFVSPMAMFLFSVFLMFAVFQALGFTTPSKLTGGEAIRSEIATAEADITATLKEKQAELAALPENSPKRSALETEVQENAAALDGFKQSTSITGKLEDGTQFNITGLETLDEGILKKWRENPGLMLYKLQANSYKFSWLLIPLSIPFVSLLFLWRRRFKAYDHAIFVTYSLAFTSLLFIVLSVLGTVGVPMPLVLTAGALIPPVHIYKQLRHTYELRRFSAFWRLLAILLFINIVIVLFLQLLLLLGAF